LTLLSYAILICSNKTCTKNKDHKVSCNSFCIDSCYSLGKGVVFQNATFTCYNVCLSLQVRLRETIQENEFDLNENEFLGEKNSQECFHTKILFRGRRYL